MAFRWACVLARFELGQPAIGFLGGYMQSCGLIVIPRRQCLLSYFFPLLPAFYILRHRLPRDPVPCPAAGLRQPLYSLFHGLIESNAGTALLP